MRRTGPSSPGSSFALRRSIVYVKYSSPLVRVTIRREIAALQNQSQSWSSTGGSTTVPYLSEGTTKLAAGARAQVFAVRERETGLRRWACTLSMPELQGDYRQEVERANENPLARRPPTHGRGHLASIPRSRGAFER